MITNFLNFISVCSTVIVFVGLFYFVSNLFFGRISIFDKKIRRCHGVKVKHLVFYLTGLIFIVLFFDFHHPWG